MFEKLWDILGEILAVVLVVVYALVILNANFGFLNDLPEIILTILKYLQNFGSLALVGIVGMEAMSKRNFVFKIIFLALCAIVVVFLFFPGTYENLISQIS